MDRVRCKALFQFRSCSGFRTNLTSRGSQSFRQRVATGGIGSNLIKSEQACLVLWDLGSEALPGHPTCFARNLSCRPASK
jgi:hypothetical protein